jgi:rhamnosyltransferase
MMERRPNVSPRAAAGTRPRTLVLLATFNGARWVEQQIESILGQIDADPHIVVFDDGSTDDTVARIRAMGRSDRITVHIPAAPSGSAAQNFFGLIRANSASGFDFVAFADQDDVWCKDKLSRAGQRLAATGAAGYSSAVLAVWEDGREMVLKQRARQTRGDFLYEGAGQGCTFVLTEEFYARVRAFFLERRDLTAGVFFHDWAVYALARCWGLPWTFDARASVRYRQHSDNAIGARGSGQGATRRLALIRSGWYRAQLNAIAELCAAAAPDNDVLRSWRTLLQRADSVPRRLQASTFTAMHGRRKWRDRAVLVISALMGWL